MKCISLPGIKAVSYIPTEHLPADLIYQAISGYQIYITSQSIPITQNGTAVCDLEQSPDNNTQIEKAKLTFSTLDSIPTSAPLAFLIETVNGDN